MNYKHLVVETIESKVGFIKLNKEDSYNALNISLIQELSDAIKLFEDNNLIGAIVLTGGNKVFAAGVDIKELINIDTKKAYESDFISKEWFAIENHNKPIIAAVSGYALGGGCELALMCDIIICDQTAKFGQPEIKIGTMPGIGGTQRLTRIIGKSKAMQLCLTGDMLDSNDAKIFGLVSSVVENDKLIEEAINIALKIASMSQPVVKLIKKSINNAYELELSKALKIERKYFYDTFDLEDKKEGMSAFIEKRKANFINK